MMNLFELSNITFSYENDEPPVFKDFCFSLKKGQCISIEGENGAGKTTLFRILNGLSFPQKGKFVFDGDIITQAYLKDNKKAKLFHKRIGYLFQNPDLMLFNANVYDEVAFGPRQMGLSDEEVETRTKDCLKLFDLETLEGKAPYHLSGGQKKRVAMASIMSLNPEILILDEPFSGLDQKSQDSLMKFLIDLKAFGKTILITTHNPDVREKIADDVLMIEK